jgi:hypothetical protein
VLVFPFLVVFVPVLVVGRLRVGGVFVFVPVLVIFIVLPPVVLLILVVLVDIVLPPPMLVVELLRFIELLFAFAFPLSDEQLAPSRAKAKSADNVNVFFIDNFSFFINQLPFRLLIFSILLVNPKAFCLAAYISGNFIRF